MKVPKYAKGEISKRFMNKPPLKRLIPQPKHEFKDDDLFMCFDYDYLGDLPRITTYKNALQVNWRHRVPFNEHLAKTQITDYLEHIKYIYGIKEHT